MLKTFRFSEIWTHVRSRQKSLSARFDAAIDSLLAALLTALSNSSLRHHRAVDELLYRFTATTEESEIIHEIVSQRPGQRPMPAMATAAPGLSRAVSRGARVGFVGIVLMVVWWSWPSTESSVAQSMATREPTPSPVVTVPLAIVNPANMTGVQATATVTPEAPQRQPALVSMPSLAGLDAETTAEPPSQPEDSLGESDALLPASELPEVLPVTAEAAAEAAAALEAEIVVIAAAPKGMVETFLIPTPAGSPTPTPDIPFVKIITAPGFALPDGVETATATPTPTATPVPIALSPGRLWSNFTPKPATESTHFWVDRPFPESIGNKIASPNYQFGSTAGGRYRIHHGMDISSPSGTLVRAAVAGEVVHAGWDDPEWLGPYGGFYGNSVVIRLDRRLPVAGGELDVYLLYGHLSEVTTAVGTRVDIDDIVGRVGMTGIAIGPHLHVEMRIGANSYEQSVNPYLWVKPTNNGGAVAVRLLSADGRTWPGARLSLARFQGSTAVWARQIEIYRGTENIGPDPAWGENGAMGSVPPGHYYVIGRVNGETIRTEIDVNPGETTFVELRTQQ